MPVITIAREYGAGGAEIACDLARELGAEICDRSLIAEVARRTRLPPEEVAAEDELGRSLPDRILRTFVPVGEAAAGWAIDPVELVDRHVLVERITRVALREAARSGNAVIVGRGGASELRDEPTAYHVFLWAPEPDRVRAVRERLACDEATARRTIHRIDASRSSYVHEVYGVDWRDPHLYDLVLNTGRLGHAASVAAILGAVGARRMLRRSGATEAAEPVQDRNAVTASRA